ncbi:hypothetical protein ACTPD5_22070, partial [Clostridioides difficile]
LKELKNRIVGRGTETEAEIEKRFSCAYEEIKMIKDYDYFIFKFVLSLDLTNKITSLYPSESKS